MNYIDCNSTLNTIAPAFRPFFQDICQDLKLGLCKTKVDLEKIPGSDNQIRLVLPYCSKKLRWEIIFDSSAPWFAPDFRFDDDSFLCNIDEEFLEKNLPSLDKWQGNDPSALRNVISELIALYKLHQIKKLTEDESSRAFFEYSSLIGDELISENDVEVWVGSHVVVEFLIKLNIDISKLPELYNEGTEHNPGVDTALLLVRFPNSTNVELIMSPFLTQALGNITLPPMYSSSILMDYVPMITKLLNNKIEALVDNEKLKRELLAQLIVKYGGGILEHDANSAAFLFQLNDFFWILQIDIDSKFPENPPILILRSVYHLSNGKPKSKILSACPYNNFEEYIEQQVEIFKIECRTYSSKNQVIDVET